ncbi:unnamed protein product [Ostreobium quekettii]|uniref:AAA+ ATPase domain-containing protein n=1 Tax=Ostreobium quekettii TaxID=121088 RepID=A0A8S1J3J5_9CHLO|nr:unnamed protein product [Ostreobium quekettii]|eukprot:evm.model.scf_555EXC.6 EVM.evm.TU.scf_555EXC.6   scf_555EXC:48582-54773(-)
MQPVAPTMQSLILTVLLSTGMFLATIGRPNAQEISFHQLKTDLLQTSLVERLEVVNKDMVKVYLRRKPRPTPQAEGEMEFEGSEPVQTLPAVYKFYFYIGSVDLFERQLEEAQLNLGRKPEEFVPVTFVTQWNIAQELLSLAPMLLIFGAFMWFNRGSMGAFTGSGGGGRNLFNVGKAQVKVLDKNAKDKVTFKDVAGCDEAKVEIMEFVSFLKAPTKYRELGARIPKGALLVGPPGTGKTLLAKATAGEANVPFLSISGSDFIEMFVGIGPARVRDLFTQAKAQSPSIVFIDEIDAIGRSRGRGGFAGSNDERESTLNQLLVEMDGFSSSSGVVVLAGTNRPDVLDKALLRAGRFDRQISLDKPDIRGREQIFRVHLAKIKLSRPLEYFSERLGALTPGFAGADIANVCNEAALIAARSGKSSVDLSDFEAAVDRVIGGLEKANKVISKEERRTVAYHESGHAVVSWFLEHAEPLMKVSIVPRGTAALGFAQYLPNENLLATTEQLTDMACVALGGRAAEEVLIGRISTGAQNDLERVTKMAHAQVGIYGMNGRVGLVSYPQDDNAFSRPYSEATAQLMDEEVRALVDRAYARTVQMVKEKRHLVSSMAEALLEREVLNLEDVEGLLGPRPFKSEELRNIDRYRKGLQAAAPTTEGAAGPHSSQRALDNSKPSSGPSTAEDSGATDVDPEAPTEVGEQVGCGDGSGAGCSGVGAAGESEAGRCQGGRGRRTAAS